ncbi:MAG: hypothetical protein HUJ14_17560 [Marinobacter sp.]|nr:hypothetical protein [Marinobacter sp.]
MMVSLSKGINLNRESEAQKAFKLAVYLFAVGEVAPARDLVSSFAFDIPYSEKSGVWAIKKEALAFLAFMATQHQQADLARKPVDEIFVSNPNIDIDDTDWVFEQAIDQIEYYKPREAWNPSLLHDLTLNEKITGHFSTIAELAFPFVCATLLPTKNEELASALEKIITAELGWLRLELQND